VKQEWIVQLVRGDIEQDDIRWYGSTKVLCCPLDNDGSHHSERNSAKAHMTSLITRDGPMLMGTTTQGSLTSEREMLVREEQPASAIANASSLRNNSRT
jgi:hypothetical protein